MRKSIDLEGRELQRRVAAGDRVAAEHLVTWYRRRPLSLRPRRITRLCKIVQGRRRERVTVVYGFDGEWALRNNQPPYFSIVNTSGSEITGRCFPEIAPLRRWHLTSIDGTPIHYVANGVYWWREAYPELGDAVASLPYPDDPFEMFSSSVVFGVTPFDTHGTTPFEVPGLTIQEWLELRLPFLQVAFFMDMERFGFFEDQIPETLRSDPGPRRRR